MALDGLVIHSIVDELHKKLLGGKIDKVYQPENDEVVLHIYSLKEINVIDVNELFTSRDIDCVDQYEVILPRELEMSIKGYSVQDGTAFIEIEII